MARKVSNWAFALGIVGLVSYFGLTAAYQIVRVILEFGG